METQGVVRLGIVGCGAAAEQRHLPASKAVEGIQVVALVDKDVERARLLGRRFGVSLCNDDYRELIRNVDGAIIAVPNYLHARIAAEFLEAGVPVLVEKPLATSLEEARMLVDLARSNGVPLQAGYMYRFSKAARMVKRALTEGLLGPLEGFSLTFATVFGWPLASGFAWSKDQAGGGVLIDLGSHMLDLLLWWLGDVVEVEYWDDNLGGVEADCRLVLTLRNRETAVQGEVVLSRLRRLGTEACIRGRDFSIQCGFTSRLEAWIRPSGWSTGDPSFVSDFSPSTRDAFPQIYADQLRAFAGAVRTRSRPVVSGEDVLPCVALIGRCYRERKPLTRPWDSALWSVA